MRHVLFNLFVLSIIFVSVTVQAESEWQQIKRERFSVIFAPGLYEEASRVAYRLEQYLEHHYADFPIREDAKPVPIVLFHDSHTSNGNVGMPPLRSHWYNKPAPLGGAEWYDMLAVHEGRHMVQYAQLFDHPTGKLLHLFFGQTGVALFSGLMLPRWFYEGDAVVAETQMTAAGRGRNAAFHLWLRTEWLTSEPYTYERRMLGTDFDRTPYHSPYVFGYFFNHYLQTEYDNLLMDRVIDQMATGKALNFDDALLNETGLTLGQHYEKLTELLISKWRTQLDGLTLTEVDLVQSAGSSHWQSWYPIGWYHGQLVAVEVDIEDGAYLTKITDASPTRLTEIPRSLASGYAHSWKQKSIFVADDQICAVVEVEHVSQRNQQSAELQCWQESTGWEALTTQTKMTSATYADGMFLTHEFLADRRSQLVQYSSEGERLQSFDLPGRSLAYDITPAAGGWVFVMQLDDGHGIFHINYQLNDLTLLKAAEQENLRSPLLTSNWLLYTSDYSGIDQVMSLSRLTGEAFQVSARPYGNYFLNHQPEARQLVLSDYTATGQQIIQIPFDDSPLAPSQWINQSEILPAEPIAGAPPVIETAQTRPEYAVSPYRWQSNWWNPHSWWGYYDGDFLRAGIASTNVFEDLSINVNLGVSPARNDWVGALDVTHRLPSGTLISANLAREPFDARESLNQFGAQVAQPFLLSQGVTESELLPAASVNRLITDSGEQLTALGLQVAYSAEKQSSYHDIGSPRAWHLSLAGQRLVETAGQTWLAATSYRQRGLEARQSLLAHAHLQTVTGGGLAIMVPSPLFEGSTTEPSTLRAGLSYEWNLGPIGKSWSRALYWRSQSLVLKLDGQWSDETEWATGLSWSPHINLLRNEFINLSPQLSAYYLPSKAQWRVLFSFNLAELPL